MAKYEINVYNEKTGEIEKTLTRNFMPSSLFIEYQRFSEKILADEFKTGEELISALKPLMLATFPELTEKDFDAKTDASEIYAIYAKVVKKTFSLNEKN